MKPEWILVDARGFWAGFEGDWHAAAHFLIPQAEPAIRHLFEMHGLITSKLDAQHIQEVMGLDRLLGHPEAVKILGEDIVFELRGCLIEDFGFRLRHRFSHGLMTDNDSYSGEVVHLWWLLLRLCVLAWLFSLSQPARDPSASKEGKADLG